MWTLVKECLQDVSFIRSLYTALTSWVFKPLVNAFKVQLVTEFRLNLRSQKKTTFSTLITLARHYSLFHSEYHEVTTQLYWTYFHDT